MTEDRIEEIIRQVITNYSYHLSQECISELASRIAFEVEDGYVP